MQLNHFLLVLFIAIGIAQPLTAKTDEAAAPTELTKKQIARMIGLTLELAIAGTVFTRLQFKGHHSFNMHSIYYEWTHNRDRACGEAAVILTAQFPIIASIIHAGYGLGKEAHPIVKSAIRKFKTAKN